METWVGLKSAFLDLQQDFLFVQEEVSLCCTVVVMVICFNHYFLVGRSSHRSDSLVKLTLAGHLLIQGLMALNGSEYAFLSLFAQVFILDAWIILRKRV